ncbi:probable protein phosphatase CG10417 isoform X1 [Drosophila gunungcola]|uniref:probable protein phosphatase CG10417 isoform X1 n=1 Tax=Drosophila gunungcola TaxID=103775 RepID=UPI0022E92901|nr:probable protein phosphatase CG10417 isoform X1 [Drosophila gunungcola]XP_052842635.1 probable protein phosphatase CG10417 isoform X1 [Drosophila gunungcola]XP_052842636.1 probable protein phosphatase CG10417 isoform X1 [Drosophila gunungcola]
MGAYLSHPKTDKASTDEFNEFLAVGASSMQGWRNSQEDAHNSILNFDKNTSFFAVYDGHGGAEVAQYCAEKLPEFLRNLETYKNNQLENALKDAFLGFDKTLLDPPIVSILKILAGEHNFVDADAEDYDDEDLAELQEESNLPLNEVLEKYKGLPQSHDSIILKSENEANLKMLSPYLRGRRAAAVAAEAANKAVMDPTAKPEGSSTSAAAAAAAASIQKLEDESTVSSSNNAPLKNLTLDKKQESNGSVSKADRVTSSDPRMAEVGKEQKEEKNAQESFVSGSNDIGKANRSAQTLKGVITGISSTSKESEKILKKTNSQEDESTDDDADYEENDQVESPDVSSAESSDEDVKDSAANDDDDDDDEVEVSDEEETDEDQMANDNFCANMIEEPGKDSGCTAVVCLLHGRDLYVANAGDSRCVISRNGRAIEMSLDHKPEDEEESSRIIKAGGRVTLDGRVNGGLNLSRALGDHAYKTNLELPAEEQMISALPDIKKLIITPHDEFMVLACDGIWNYMSSEEVVDFVRIRLKDKSKKLSKICEELFDNCLAPNTMGDGTGCDNMTAVIVKFQEKLQKLQTTIDPTETEDVLANTFSAYEKVLDVNTDQSTLKRGASPDTAAEITDLDKKNKSKRLKTDENVIEPAEITSSNLSPANQNECPSIKTSNEVTIVVSSS